LTHSEEHLGELRSALLHLQDPAYLETHPLSSRIDLVAEAPGLSRGQLLRRALRLAIEALDPGPEVAANAPESRPYQVLRGRYVAGHSMQEVARELDIGDRQAYRELRRGLEGLAAIVAAGACAGARMPEPGHGIGSTASGVRVEVERLLSAGDAQAIELGSMIAYAIDCARSLAAEYNVTLEWQAPIEQLYVITDRIMLRQAVLNLLSGVIQRSAGGDVAVRLDHLADNAVVDINWHGPLLPESPEPSRPSDVGGQLLDALALPWSVQQNGSNSAHLRITVPVAGERSILVIDDNEGLIRLFERYLEGHPYRFTGVSDPDAALSAIKASGPDVIIIDVMMPRSDGWEMLQAIRRTPQGQRAAIIICSIINDPDLARALGADGFLHKPVDRASLVQAVSTALGASR